MLKGETPDGGVDRAIEGDHPQEKKRPDATASWYLHAGSVVPSKRNEVGKFGSECWRGDLMRVLICS